MSQGAIADNTQLASRSLTQSRIAASQSDKGREALAQEVSQAKAQLKEIKEESNWLVEYFMARAAAKSNFDLACLTAQGGACAPQRAGRAL